MLYKWALGEATLLALFFFLLLVPSGAVAGELFRRVTFLVRPDSVVKGEEIRLKDIATFGRAEKEFVPLLEKLKELKLGDAPAPRSKTTLIGAAILQKIEEAGVEREVIGYSIPKTVNVARDGRVVTQEEVLLAIKSEIAKNKSADIQLRGVEWGSPQVIPVGESQVAVEVLGTPVSGKFPIRVEISVDGKLSSRFLATAIADDWREIPVLSRAIDRGGIINPEDLHLVRMNLASQPADVAGKIEEVFGKRAKSRLNAGEVVRKSFIDIPPVVPKGKRVTVIYDKGLLRATATGIALEDGYESSRIAIRNESSKKTIMGKVLNTEEVEASN
jgi:flagella basal body P-ring formation protein FlgA